MKTGLKIFEKLDIWSDASTYKYEFDTEGGTKYFEYSSDGKISKTKNISMKGLDYTLTDNFFCCEKPPLQISKKKLNNL